MKKCVTSTNNRTVTPQYTLDLQYDFFTLWWTMHVDLFVTGLKKTEINWFYSVTTVDNFHHTINVSFMFTPTLLSSTMLLFSQFLLCLWFQVCCLSICLLLMFYLFILYSGYFCRPCFLLNFLQLFTSFCALFILFLVQ